jgi:predicted PurR-regulated permease PerM
MKTFDMKSGWLRQLRNRRASGVTPDARSQDAAELGDGDLPTPADIKGIYLGGLFLLAILAACYAAGEILLPIVLAFVLKLVLQPMMRALGRLHVPQVIAALLIVLVLFGTLVGLGAALSAPAASWVQKLPPAIPKLEDRMRFIIRPFVTLENYIEKAQALTPGAAPKPVPVAIRGPRLLGDLLASTRSFAGGLFETALVLFFTLISRDIFLRRLVEVLPRFRNKRQAVEISQQIEHDVSLYLFTITIMNLVVGVSYGLVTLACGLDDPLLWGAVAFLLNFVPILGPALGVGIFLLAGLLSMNSLWQAFLPAAFYLLIHVTEGEILLPMLVARRFTINPVLVVLALVFWYWMWGVPGAILATPMLAITQIVCDRVRPLRTFGHFIEGGR